MRTFIQRHVLFAPTATGAPVLINVLGRAATMWLFVAALVMTDRRRLARQQLTGRAA